MIRGRIPFHLQKQLQVQLSEAKPLLPTGNCVFFVKTCQLLKSKLCAQCSVTTFKNSQQILKGAKCDHDLSLRVSGVNDLTEGKYQPNCYKKFQRSVSRSIDIAKDDSGAVLLWLVDELKTSAEQGHILGLNSVASLLFSSE